MMTKLKNNLIVLVERRDVRKDIRVKFLWVLKFNNKDGKKKPKKDNQENTGGENEN